MLSGAPRIVVLAARESSALLFSTALESAGASVTAETNPAKALKLVHSQHTRLLVTEEELASTTAAAVLDSVTPPTLVLVIGAQNSPERAIQAIESGAAGYITKPIAMREFRQKVQAILDHGLASKAARLAPHFHYVLLRQPADQALAIARQMYALSPAARGPFQTLDCGATPADSLKDALFGHMRYAFESAAADEPGLLEKARGGVLALLNLDASPLWLQAELGHALKRNESMRIGSLSPRKIRLRIVASATSGPLHESLDPLLVPLQVTHP